MIRKTVGLLPPEASLDGLMQTSVASGFLIGFYWSGAKPETSEPSEGEKIWGKLRRTIKRSVGISLARILSYHLTV